MRVAITKNNINRMNLYRLLNTYSDVAIYNVVGTNRFITIFNARKIGIHGLHEVIEEEKVKNPIWKQTWQMQIGRKPQEYESRFKPMHIKEIDCNSISTSTMIELYMGRI